MSVSNNLAAILSELSANRAALDDESLAGLVEEVLAAGHVFLAGAGRSGIASAGFANRLLHLGKSVSLVGEITAPHSRAGDLLIIGSGSGATSSLVALARKAQAAGVRIALLTTDPASEIGQLANVVVTLPGASKSDAGARASIQPMGSAFEQLAFLTYDAVVLELMSRLGETSETMYRRHADLE